MSDIVTFAKSITVDGKPLVLLPHQEELLRALERGDFVIAARRFGMNTLRRVVAEYEKRCDA